MQLRTTELEFPAFRGGFSPRAETDDQRTYRGSGEPWLLPSRIRFFKRKVNPNTFAFCRRGR